MNSAENWISDDLSVVELFLKSLDNTESGHQATVNNAADTKVGYEPHSVNSVHTQTIKQEPQEYQQYPHLYNYGYTQPRLNESWKLGNEYTSNFDSLKVVPELLVERICHEESYPQQFNPSHFKLESPGRYYCNQVHCKLETPPQPCSQQQMQLEPKICHQQVNGIVVKQEPADDSMDLSGHFMCHPMFIPPPSAAKCGCELSKSQQHFLCSNKTMEEYGELLKRGSAALLGESQPKIFPPSQNIRSDKERPYSCDECGKSFLLKHHLVTHSRVHSGLRPYCCTECGKTFAHKHCLVTHQRLHSGLRPYQCLECKKSFTLKHHLVTHARTHSKDRPYQCDDCGSTFAQKRNLVTHAKLHSGERPFQCAICGECFSQREHLLAHSRFHGGESAFVCIDCGEAFARKFQLVDHRRQHGHSPYSCTVCGKEFLQKRTLVAHSKLHEGHGSYPCKHCSQSFPRMGDLIAHSKIHNTFTCKDCGCSFATNEEFVQHLQNHSRPVNSKPYSCTECGSAFAQKHGLVQHVNRKHNQARDIMEHIKHQVLSEQLKAKIQ